MATSYEKFPLGAEDMLLDVNGSGQVEPVPTSGGGNRNVHRIGARDIYASTTLRDKKYADGTTAAAANDITVDKVLQQVLDDLEDLGQPDDVTLQNASGVLRIKALGVDSPHIQTGAIDIGHMSAESVNSDQYVDRSIDTVHLALNAVTPNELADDSVTTAKILDGQVTEAKLANDSVTPNKTDFNGSGGTFSHYIVDAGTLTLAGTTTAEVETIVCAVDDLLIATPVSGWAVNNTMAFAAISDANEVTITSEGTIPAGSKVAYCVLRAVTP